jgi:hypothetical protein
MTASLRAAGLEKTVFIKTSSGEWIMENGK